jgi:hypothetical protein
MQPPGEGCTDADKFGMCYGVVGMLNRMVTDLLDVAAAISDQEEMAKSALSWVPVFGQFWEAAVDFAAGLLNWVIDSYPLAFTTGVQEDIACAFYCAMGDGCDLTVDTMLTVLYGLLGNYAPPPSTAPIREILAWFALFLGSTSLAVVSAAMLIVLEMWARGTTWLGASPNVLLIAARLSTSVDPSGICGACQDCGSYLGPDDDTPNWPIEEYFGTTGFYDENDVAIGTWSGILNSGKFVQIHRYPVEYLNAKMRIHYDIQNTRGGLGTWRVTASGVQIAGSGAYPPNGTGVLEFSLPDDPGVTNDVIIQMGCRTVGDDAGAWIKITSIEVCNDV